MLPKPFAFAGQPPPGRPVAPGPERAADLAGGARAVGLRALETRVRGLSQAALQTVQLRRCCHYAVCKFGNWLHNNQ